MKTFSGVTNSGIRYMITTELLNKGRYYASLTLEAEAACDTRKMDLAYDLPAVAQALCNETGIDIRETIE